MLRIIGLQVLLLNLPFIAKQLKSLASLQADLAAKHLTLRGVRNLDKRLRNSTFQGIRSWWNSWYFFVHLAVMSQLGRNKQCAGSPACKCYHWLCLNDDAKPLNSNNIYKYWYILIIRIRVQFVRRPSHIFEVSNPNCSPVSDLYQNLVKITGLQVLAPVQLHNATYTFTCRHSGQTLLLLLLQTCPMPQAHLRMQTT